MIWHEYKRDMTFYDQAPFIVWDSEQENWFCVHYNYFYEKFFTQNGKEFGMENVTHIGIIEAPEVRE